MVRSLKLDPLVNRDDLLVSISLDRDITSEEEEGEWGDHGGVVEEHGRTLDLGVVDEKLVVK